MQRKFFAARVSNIPSAFGTITFIRNLAKCKSTDMASGFTPH